MSLCYTHKGTVFIIAEWYTSQQESGTLFNQYIHTLDKAFSENEKGQSGNIPTLSSQVALAGQFSNHFFTDLKRIALLEI